MVTSVGNVAELIAAVSAGSRVDYLFFWGHQPRADGRIGAECLSQWWPAPFTLDGLRFATAEHYMMWRKAVLFDDHARAAQILTVDSPEAVKALGRRVVGFDPQTWQRHRFDIVVTGNRAKFDQHRALGAYLLDTGERVLVEASPFDQVWGIGLAADHPDAIDPAGWRGLNLLGFALMQARTILRDQQPSTATPSSAS
ncbi:NADAR family protein [Micromonospora sp. NPDC048871]|uniref:NADAR family protein n=1 Tax=unclassified Micromonospora TaxID=2617518 RepID=UPI002E0DE5A3|nr:NADAR family protein [Micromonospora sp. NBC_01739]